MSARDTEGPREPLLHSRGAIVALGVLQLVAFPLSIGLLYWFLLFGA